MAITVGLIKELYFISHVLKQDVNMHLRIGPESRPIVVSVSPEGIFKVYYKEFHIWTERVEGDTSFFGVESCDTIARIIVNIENGTEWKNLVYLEN